MKKLLPVLMAAFLAASCDFFPGPDAALPAGAQGGGELTVYFEGPGSGNGKAADAARTLLPVTPGFTSYDLTFTDTAEVNPKPNEQRSVTASGQPVSLPLGEWDVQVDAFIGTEPDKYRAASGSSANPITVSDGTNAPVSVILRALAISGGESGIFSWNITYSGGTGNLAAADITLHPFSAGVSTENDISIDLKSASFNSTQNISAGYYDVSVTLENDAGKTAGLHTTAHIYPRLTTQAVYDFTPAHFVSEVMLAGTVTVTKPAGVILSSITVQSYRNAERTVELGQAVTVPVIPFGNGVTNATSGEWVKKIPAPGNAVYFKVIASDGTGTYIADDDAGTIVPDNGKAGIDLSLTIPGTATVITAWVDGEAIATSADGTPPTITRTPGVTADTNKLTINVDPPATGSYSDITWTVDTEGVTADSPPYSLPTAVSAYTFDATWKSDGTYNIGLSVTKDGNTYSTTITVKVQDYQ